jgi:LysR family nod box-dependent transcriptional activator
VHLDGFNLNLLVALDTLFDAPTLTEAAERLTLTQSALSGALKRLREHYGDPLIVYSPAGPRLTPLAEQLKPLVRRIIVAARDSLRLQPSFDPQTSPVDLAICAPDWLELILLKDLLRTIATQAPNMRVAVRSTRPQPADELFGEGADLVVTTAQLQSPHHSSDLLFEERIACIAWTGNTRLQAGLTHETFVTSLHAGMVGEPDNLAPAFRRMSEDRKIVIRTSVHAALPEIIIGTELLAVTSRRFAEQAARSLPVAVFPLPYVIPPLNVICQWQHYRDSDPMMLWVRERLKECVVRLDRHHSN